MASQVYIDLQEKLHSTVGRKRKKHEISPEIFNLIVESDLIAMQNEKTFAMKETPISPPAKDRLNEMKVPLLIIYGDLDEPDIVEANKLMIKEFNAKSFEMKGTTHFPNLERPKEFNSIILEFLNGL